MSANVGSIVSDVTKADISTLMDDIHEEYTEYCHNNNKEAKFDRANLPNKYGGKVDLLLGYPTFRPTIVFKSVASTTCQLLS